MGTKALVRVYDEEDALILYMFVQGDGHPRTLGAELHKKLGKLNLVNGFKKEGNEANGMGCFAAQLVAALKTNVGRFYLQAPSEDVSWAVYVYDFRVGEDRSHVHLRVTSGQEALYVGRLKSFRL